MSAARVLVVDDDVDVLMAVTRVLEREGYEELPAEGPRRALAIVANSRRSIWSYPIMGCLECQARS